MAGDKKTGQLLKEEGITFVTVGLLGIVITFFFQFFSWYRDANLRRVEKNVDNALQASDQATLLVSDRWYATFRIIQGLSVDPRPRDFEERVKNYVRSVADWNLKSDLMLSRLEVFYDLPRQAAGPVSLKHISRIDCSKELFHQTDGEQIVELNPASFKAHYIALSHCFRGIHSELVPLLQELEHDRLRAKPELKKTIEAVQKKSDDLFTHANVFRTSLIGQAIKWRNDDSALHMIPDQIVRLRFRKDEKEQ